MDDFKAGIIASWKRNGGVYNHISCMQGATLTSIIQGVNSKYNNCARWAYLSNYVAGVLGVAIEYLHVDCDFANGLPDLNAGHYLNLLLATNEKWDAAHYASSGLSTGTMCINGYNSVIDNKVPCA
jgi:hypothetical protein